MVLDRPDSSKRKLPDMPQIGSDPHEYARICRRADQAGDHLAHEAAKVGLYITLALDPHLEWNQKQRYFDHALNNHCEPPPYPPEDVWVFFKSLAHLVREHCGAEALRLASKQDDFFAARVGMGQSRDEIQDEAQPFFDALLGDYEHCPAHFCEEDWQALRIIRDQWV